ncbi:MAG TPA: methyl-accepting chemotaxis protein [Accumulibacter sp.]|nr:methyl-accepting chemotaxis protein [Accumulibacter sp.]HMW18907.1 methyl-accepting chemotaxis protein [Accumulibacter sp.]HMY05612.1 methyl-accepting chemotaxis protein [Accumulibacter sp.]HNC17425.1 methyl-accepting chemotaxis protein [Accumulibacter sp.]HND78817.1 methyl-accepting chemotaxis protein [Accumulibacter sp.]
MFKFLRNLSLTLKFNLVQGIVLLLIISIATAWTINSLHNQLLDEAVEDMRRVNRLVTSMIAAYDRSLRADVERVGQVFVHTQGQDLQRQEGGDKPVLLRAGKRIDDQIDLVDAFTGKTGAVLTIFVRQGDDFLRSATSLKKEDGSRATGTLLGMEHPARPLLLDGKTFTGKVKLFGKDYMTYYAPARDAESKIIGAFFAAIELTDALTVLKKNLRDYTIGDTGYIFAVDAGRDKGMITIHPSLEGKSGIGFKDSKGFEFIREIVEKKTGILRYDWANPGETRSREKLMAFDSYPDWQWVIGSTCYLDELNSFANTVGKSLLLLAVAVIIASLITGFLVIRFWVARPLQQVISQADDIAAGNLQSRLDTTDNDEVGRLKKAIAQMAGNLKQTIGEVRQAAGSVFNHTSALVSAAESVSQGSESQRDSVTSMAASVEEMSASTDQVARHARDVRQMTDHSGKTASEGAAVVQQAVSAMNQITDFVRQASATVTELGHRSQDISAVVQVIREIADQTNLLALNAAIEAARAGEQGRGFAVVADEVRKLAERTAKSTHTIGEMIVHIQESADAAVKQMAEGVATVETGSALANCAGETIGAIETSTSDVSSAVGSIADAASKQSAASQTLAESIERISQMADTNHAASRNTAESAQALRDLATQLNQSLARFAT